MIKIYKEYFNGRYYFSNIFSYIILYLHNKENFFKKRTNKNKLCDNYKKSFSLKKKVINDKKKKNIVIHFPSEEISHFYFHYFVYILIPKLNLSEYDKKKIIDNIYLINNKIDENVKTYIFNKVNQSNCNIIFCNKLLPKEKYNYSGTLLMFLENKYFLDFFLKLHKKKKKKKKHLFLKRKEKNFNRINNNFYNLKKNREDTICNYLYMFYLLNYNFKKQIIIKRNKNLELLTKYNQKIKEINNNIQWFNHYSFYKFYYNAYISFLNYRMLIFQSLMENVMKKKKKNALYIFLKYKNLTLNSNIFFDFINKQILYVNFNDAATLYIKFLQLFEKIALFSNIKNYSNYNISNINEKRKYNKNILIKEIKKNMNIHIWNNYENENFHSNLNKIKLYRFYN
ncbi:conserved Plasmodium protein, unknown function [Plasmodium gallinaceum]|uniref:Uncharacterized protein n=1 Tax=Plasmodium gallinaceum TaxID=5849 RepID=A0A1J1GW34_PLAGA|nr:conserved Plasmodium protein, unknown function [Plasmodium gallinaceum]CRG96762.1 conserved Plasmodium protein, unknown function [Plasmodium gallinaceum]